MGHADSREMLPSLQPAPPQPYIGAYHEPCALKLSRCSDPLLTGQHVPIPPIRRVCVTSEKRRMAVCLNSYRQRTVFNPRAVLENVPRKIYPFFVLWNVMKQLRRCSVAETGRNENMSYIIF